MASIVNRANFSDFMQVRGYFRVAVLQEQQKDNKAFPRFYEKLFKRVTSSKQSEKFTELVGLGVMAEANEYSDVVYDSPIQGYDSELTPKSYTLGVQYSREAWDDAQEQILKQASAMLVRSARETKEILAAQIFDNGFSSVTSPDGVSLFNTAHPLEGGGTYRNRPSVDADLSLTALKQAIIDMISTTDGRGKKLFLRPRYLVVPVGLFDIAQQILKSEKEPFTADNQINYIKENPFGINLQLIVNPYLTDDDAWYLISGDINSDFHPLIYLDRKSLEVDMERVWDKNNAPRFRAYMRCVFGVKGWRGVYGSPGA